MVLGFQMRKVVDKRKGKFRLTPCIREFRSNRRIRTKLPNSMACSTPQIIGQFFSFHQDICLRPIHITRVKLIVAFGTRGLNIGARQKLTVKMMYNTMRLFYGHSLTISLMTDSTAKLLKGMLGNKTFILKKRMGRIRLGFILKRRVCYAAMACYTPVGPI